MKFLNFRQAETIDFQYTENWIETYAAELQLALEKRCSYNDFQGEKKIR